MQFALRTNTMIKDANSAFSPDQSVLNFCSTATRGRRAADASPAYAATLPRPVYESSFSTSKEGYETSNYPVNTC